MLVSFEGGEEELVNSVISVLDSGREKFLFQEIQLQSKIRHKGIAIDLKRREVVRDNRKIELTYTEFEILQLLAQNPGRVFSKELIIFKFNFIPIFDIVNYLIGIIHHDPITDRTVINTRIKPAVGSICF